MGEIIMDENQNKANVDTLTQAMDYQGGMQPVYIGRATPGTAKSAAGWQIQKLTYSGNHVTDVQWASGTAKYDKVWDSRESYTYS